MGLAYLLGENRCGRDRCRHRLVLVLVLAATAPCALAYQFNTGNPDVSIHWDNTVKYGAGWRLKSQSATLIDSPPTTVNRRRRPRFRSWSRFEPGRPLLRVRHRLPRFRHAGEPCGLVRLDLQPHQRQQFARDRQPDQRSFQPVHQCHPRLDGVGRRVTGRQLFKHM